MGPDNKPIYSPDKCIYCGDCIKVCPSSAWKGPERGYLVRIGGKGGHHPLLGSMFALFLPANRVVEFLEEVLAWYKEKAQGLGRIRIGDIIVREGADSLLNHLRGKFPDHVVPQTTSPKVLDIQVGIAKQ